MSLSQDFQAADNEIYAIFGIPAILTRVTKGTFDKRTGRPAADTNTTVNVTVLEGAKDTTQAGATKRINTYETRTEMKAGDKLTVNGVEFIITRVVIIIDNGIPNSWIADIDGETV